MSLLQSSGRIFCPAVPSVGLSRCDDCQRDPNSVFDPHWYILLCEWYLWAHDCSKPPVSVIEEPGNECYCHCVIFNKSVWKDENPKKQPGPAEERVWRRSREMGGRVCVCARVCVCMYKHTLFNSALIVSSGMEMSEFDAVKTSKWEIKWCSATENTDRVESNLILLWDLSHFFLLLYNIEYNVLTCEH